MSIWRGDLNDDCILDRYGYSAHVECMGRGDWWFAVYKGRQQVYNTADNETHVALTTGKTARAAAECVLEKVANQ